MPMDWRQFHRDETPARSVVDPRRRLRLALAGLVALLLVVLGRAVQIEVSQGAAFRELAVRPLQHGDQPARRPRPHSRPRRHGVGLRPERLGRGGPLSLLARAARRAVAAADGPGPSDPRAAERPAASGSPGGATLPGTRRVGPPIGQALRPAGRAVGRPGAARSRPASSGSSPRSSAGGSRRPRRRRPRRRPSRRGSVGSAGRWNRCCPPPPSRPPRGARWPRSGSITSSSTTRPRPPPRKLKAIPSATPA